MKTLFTLMPNLEKNLVLEKESTATYMKKILKKTI